MVWRSSWERFEEYKSFEFVVFYHASAVFVQLFEVRQRHAVGISTNFDCPTAVLRRQRQRKNKYDEEAK